MLNKIEKTQPSIEGVVQGLSVSGALLDSDGTILDVSRGWREVAESCGLSLPNYGIGSSYLRYCVFPDGRSPDIMRGIQSVLSKSVDCFSTLYPCEGHGWFMLVAFAGERSQSTSTVLHINVSGLLHEHAAPSAELLGVGPAATNHLHAAMMTTVQKAIRDQLGKGVGAPEALDSDERRLLMRLSPAQFAILRHLARGATNAEIADIEGLSISAVKTQTATLIRKLGLQNRTQAALLAVRNGVDSSHAPT